MKNLILKYLGYNNIAPDDKVNKLIEECINEVKAISKFKYIYNHYEEILPFLKDNENYLKYLEGSNGYYLVATTLGIEIDRRQKLYEKTDMTKAIVFDCVASAYIEHMADEYEKTIENDLSYRFCPGYQNTSFLDNKKIAEYLNTTKYLGINFLDSGLMVPLKSMMGIIAIGNNKKRICGNCILKKNCKYLKGGITCYQR
ncbi:MAG: hypothetical protein ACI35W_04730 [Anaeroplasmataceae bacterium]